MPEHLGLLIEIIEAWEHVHGEDEFARRISYLRLKPVELRGSSLQLALVFSHEVHGVEGKQGVVGVSEVVSVVPSLHERLPSCFFREFLRLPLKPNVK